MEDISSVIDTIRNKIIVSVQAQDNEPLNKPEHLLAMSLSVINGGAAGLRLCGIENINYIKKHVKVPIVGLTKVEPTPFNWLETVYITATMKDVEGLIETGVECIAIDGTPRPRLDNSSLIDQITLIRNAGKIVIADVSNFEEGMNAAEAGANIISTTLSGYTKHTRHLVNEGPDLDLLADLCDESPAPVIMEGRIWELEDVKEAFELGAFAVVIGTAITRPHLIIKRYTSAIPGDAGFTA